MKVDKAQPDVSVVIVSFNTIDILRRCLLAVETYPDGLTLEVIVVDNASADGSADMVAAEFPDVHLIRNEDNRMFAPATNQGLAIARGRHALLLNSDAFVRPGMIGALTRFLDQEADAAAVGPKVLNVDGTLQSKGFVAPRIGLGLLRVTGLNKLLPEGAKRRLFPRYFWDENEPIMPDVLSGCCVMFKGSVVREIGPLDESFYHGGEDGEWCFRAQRAGYRTWYLPQACVEHIGGASKAVIDTPTVLRDTVHAWETSFGLAYGLVAEALSTVYIAQRLLAVTLVARDRAARRRMIDELRLGGRKLAALGARILSGGVQGRSA